MGGLSVLGSLNPATVALSAATGGTSLLGMAARNLVSSFGQQLIQKLGDAMGLPQPMIDAAQGQFAFATGDVAGGFSNAFEAAQGFAQAGGDSFLDSADFGRNFEDAITRAASDIAGGDEFRSARSGGSGGSWLMAMARALGEKADNLSAEMEDLADQMSAENSKPSDSLEFSAKSQEFSLFMSAANNALKTAGEALNSAARKGS